MNLAKVARWNSNGPAKPAALLAKRSGGVIMKNWTIGARVMIACCNDGTRPVLFKIERIDEPEIDEERTRLESCGFSHGKHDARPGQRG